MPIEFQCEHCETVLRTPDDSAGKSARCPRCGNVQPIPDGRSDIRPGRDARVPVGLPAQQNPYAGPNVDARPTGNPYASGVGYTTTGPSTAKARVLPAAITLLVVSSLVSLLWLLGILGGVITMATEGVTTEDIVAMFVFVVGFVLSLMGVVISVFMLRMSNRKLAIAGAICSMVPNIACCGLPVGVSVWALIVLLNQEIKPFFS